VSTEQSTEVIREDALGIYLREHIAASHAAEDLSGRLIDGSEDPQVDEFLRRFVEEIQEERAHVAGLLESIEDDRGVVRKGIDVATGIAQPLSCRSVIRSEGRLVAARLEWRVDPRP